ncbi:HAD-IC family P-type ATPase [Clostridium tyrobutyricum]|uniref:P-type Ca(2+) transporter n=1 Tax=Clostridium tyrobutyricum DIVETGP TaxID=1408889 RepID=W6NJV5_CLOTY|nr:cation-translocating P-type ATPase [Clostridium tyrobutyricum]AND83777.1 ATPase, P-type (Transporting), HAD superfamily, subfamily IC [Clostridium tyrobutyricum]ANP68537.1 ATPase [Clostridium tyrobutyricum]MBV4435094.1 cation-translocating P-type ATPase [Clostridium tyrobutyricum]QNB67119.1 HAD-IC family P-type ATPase [Clostridium tyrobutyricum]CDL92212.1 Probable cation-transporting ATPase [Clostridium tyrobutyricum DIVETGP]
MKKFYGKSIPEVLDILKVSSKGLNDSEVEKRQQQYGYNELCEGHKKSIFQIFMEQFKDLLIVILIVAATVSIFTGNFESAMVIFAVIILNSILGTVQQVKAEKSLKSLKALSAPTAKVLRNGIQVEIPSREVVVGDILYLEAGDYISADGRIIENYSIQVNESSLTGESENVSKTQDIIEGDNAAIGDRKNMLFSGSLVTYGRAVIVVTGTGMKTELGKVASLLKNTEEKKTPLQVNLDNFSKKLSILILIICVLIFILDVFRGYPVMDSIMFSIALAVAAIPEALSSIVTIVLALGTQKMARENAIVKKLKAVEGLGSVSVICSDKTGTLTQNKMTVKKLYTDNKVLNSTELNLENEVEKQAVLMGILCNDASTTYGEKIGDPTEIALVDLGEIYNMDELSLRKEYSRIGEIPFDSERKIMSTVHRVKDRTLMVTKGAPDVLIDRISKIQTSSGIMDITEEGKSRIERANEDFSKTGLRVLAVTYKEIDIDKTELDLNQENDLVFVALTAMMDPPREESARAISSCIKAGIRTVMITGDHKITASAIAREIGILKDKDEAVEGYELDNLSDEELKEKVDKVSVYARVSPEHKIRIVKAWQEKDNIVAMTGDGVNDAPALKQADIGIAMGITGTEVSKDAASMVLMDDNFATIVKSICSGRNIYNNIKNSIKFLLSGNTAGIMAVLYTSLAALPIPFTPAHLLFINLVTDSLPAIALGLESYKDNVMKEKPRNINTPILTKAFGKGILIEGLIIAAFTILAFYTGLKTGDHMLASTMAFSTLCLSRLFHGFNCRSRESIFKIGLFSNKYVWFAFGLGVALLSMVLFLPPLKAVFEISNLNLKQVGTIVLFSFMTFVLIQISKLMGGVRPHGKNL